MVSWAILNFTMVGWTILSFAMVFRTFIDVFTVVRWTVFSFVAVLWSVLGLGRINFLGSVILDFFGVGRFLILWAIRGLLGVDIGLLGCFILNLLMGVSFVFFFLLIFTRSILTIIMFNL